MYIHELHNPLAVVYATHELSGRVVLIDPVSGAIFDYPNICDIINISLATGDLFADTWRVSTLEEQDAFTKSTDNRRVRPTRLTPLIKGPPALTVITGDKS